MKPWVWICCILITFLCACKPSKKDDIKKIVHEWQGKEILKPAEINCKFLGRDTVCVDLWDKPYKIFTYIDSIGCTGCQLGLPEWKTLIDSCRQQNLDISFIFAVHSSDYKRFTDALRFNEFNCPVIYDVRNSFDRLNHFPPAPYRTFLLDRNNQVLLVGSPARNPKVWELYKKTIIQ